jgi:hypothetical protein
VTGRVGGRSDLLRFVLDPDGVVTPDFSGALPGRGAWVAAERTAVEEAGRRMAFSRAFRREARLRAGLDPAAFAGEVETALAARALSALGLARRAGDVAPGYEKARARAETGAAALVLIARDAADGGAEKLARAAGATPVCRAFDAAAQSAALGLDGVVYAALSPGGAADRLLVELRRLAGFRAGAAATTPAPLKPE